jgi:hypothetical protein
MVLSAIIPTIDGREALLEQTIASLAETAGCDVDLVVVRNAPTGGAGWNEGAAQATGTHLWFGADDLTFVPGWVEAALQKEYPCPRILKVDGTPEACGTLGQGATMTTEMEDDFPCHSSPFPFMTRELWDEIGPALPIHYYVDDYLAVKARTVGLDIRLARGYTVIHHEGTAGRGRMVTRAMSDRAAFIRTIGEEQACRKLPIPN